MLCGRLTAETSYWLLGGKKHTVFIFMEVDERYHMISLVPLHNLRQTPSTHHHYVCVCVCVCVVSDCSLSFLLCFPLF